MTRLNGHRVVVTGFGAITSLGQTPESILANVLANQSGIKVMTEWQDIAGLNTQLGGPVLDFSLPAHYTRKKIRAMGRVAKFATLATEHALIDADLLGKDILTNGQTGIAYGSCSGSAAPLKAFADVLEKRTTAGINATTYIKLMSHTTAVNAALFFGLKGRVITTSSACTSSSQAIGYAYEAIKYGQQQVMIAGGAEELCPTQAAIFDTLYATSLQNNTPETTPKPFDSQRDGLVIGEGSCTVILENRDHALARGARIYAEVIGFGTNCDAEHVTQPTAETMQQAMQLALNDAAIVPSAINYVCAHGTATERGDIAESQATAALFSPDTAISSLKGHFGHTLGACGSLESMLSIKMMLAGQFAATRNLQQVDPACGALNYIKDQPLQLACDTIMSNNFAFGGINTSLIFKKHVE